MDSLLSATTCMDFMAVEFGFNYDTLSFDFLKDIGINILGEAAITVSSTGSGEFHSQQRGHNQRETEFI